MAQNDESSQLDSPNVPARWLGLFEDRYGDGAFARLLAMLQQPCVSFAQIAERFGVSRERVRQWHLRFLPDAPRGHQRRRLCLIQQEKRRLLADPLFRAFYRHARSHLGSGDLALIRGRDGYRKRAVHLGSRLIVIKSARAIRRARRQITPAYALASPLAPADFIYYRLSDTEYLLVPGGLVPRAGTTFQDTGDSRYQAYRNSFAAVHAAPVLPPEDATPSWATPLAGSRCGQPPP